MNIKNLDENISNLDFEDNDYDLDDQRDSYPAFKDNELFGGDSSRSVKKANLNDDMHHIME